MKFNRKTFTVVLIALITLSMLCAAATSVVQAVSVSVNDPAAQNRGPVSVGGDYGLRLGFGGAFTEIGVSMPTWSTTDSACTLSLYAWDTNYDTTIASDPIVSKRFDPLIDNARNTLTFDPLPAGEYFLRIHDVRGQVGVWAYDYKSCGGYVYTNGTESRKEWDVSWAFTVTFRLGLESLTQYF